jgi:hypothetical protein
MKYKNNPLFILLLIINVFGLFGQSKAIDSLNNSKNLKFKYESLIVPTVLIGFGVVGIENDGLKALNAEIKEEVNENIDGRLTIDDFTQYAPALSVYVINALGIEGKNSFRDRTVILGTAYLIMGTTVTGLKKMTRVQRPDGSSYDSFPSGHTATAFMGAEFLWQEYKDVSIWYGISGYLVATSTGFFRIYNNRHWLTDVVTGAGIGILSTKVAYWLQPLLSKILFKNKKQRNGVAMPFYNGKEFGMSVALAF